MKRFQILIATAVLLGGCQDKPWRAHDRNGIPMSQGEGECRSLAKTNAGSIKNPEILNDLYNTCMRQRGF